MTNVRPFYKFVQNYEMQRLILNVLALIFLFVSCKSTNEKDIIPKKDFLKVLTEIYITDAYLSTLNSDSAKRVIFPLYDNTFRKYDLDSTSFKKNLSFYGSDAEVMNKIYEEVGKNLKNMNDGYIKTDQVRMDSIRRKDSIQNAHFQDSLTRINDFKELYESQKKLILNYKQDSVKWDYKKAAQEFYNKSGLKGNLNLGTFLLKNMSVPATSKSDSTATKKVEAKSIRNGQGPKLESVKASEDIPLKTDVKEVRNPVKQPLLLDRKVKQKTEILSPEPVK